MRKRTVIITGLAGTALFAAAAQANRTARLIRWAQDTPDPSIREIVDAHPELKKRDATLIQFFRALGQEQMRTLLEAHRQVRHSTV